jgi:hypothetical protein
MSKSRDGLEFLTMYPETRKWVKQCIACQSYGYNPEMPETANYYRNVKMYFPPMKVNDIGVCEQCEKNL